MEERNPNLYPEVKQDHNDLGTYYQRKAEPTVPSKTLINPKSGRQ